MDVLSWIIERCDHTYQKGNWAGRGVLPALEGIGVAEANWRPHLEQHTIAEIALHMAYWKDAVTARFTGQPWEYDEKRDWREVAPTDQGWEEARAELQAAHLRLMETLRALTPDHLMEPVGKAWWSPEAQVRRIDLAVDIATHDTYHAAQIFVLRRLFGGEGK